MQSKLISDKRICTFHLHAHGCRFDWSTRELDVVCTAETVTEIKVLRFSVINNNEHMKHSRHKANDIYLSDPPNLAT